MEVTITTEELLNLIDNKKIKEIREIFETTPAIDIAEVCEGIDDVKKLIFIFKTVKSEYTADLFTNLSSEKKEEIIKAMSDTEIAKLLDDQFTDDIVDFIEDLPANVVSLVLRNVDKEKRNDINRLLNYKENTAGSIMTTEYMELRDTLTVDKAIQQIRRIGKDKETIYTIFIRDDSRNLVGTLGLEELVFAHGDEVLSDLMDRDFQTVNVNVDQEEVAQIFKRYDLHALAVTNNENRLTGIITIDDVVDVIDAEATEDMSKLALVSPMEDDYLKTGVFKMARKSAPWLIILMVMGVFTSIILSKAENALTVLPVLTVFVPLIMGTGGNASNQSVTVIIRSLAMGELTIKDTAKILWKEFRVGLIVATFVGVFSFLWFLAEMYMGLVAFDDTSILWAATGDLGADLFLARCQISLVVTITLFVAVVLARVIGSMITMLIKAIHLDPALIASPFVTTIIDVSSLLIYFGFAVYVFQLVSL